MIWKRPIKAAVHVGLDQPRLVRGNETDLLERSRIYEALGRGYFTWRGARAVVEANPSWSSINREVVRKLVPPANFGH